MLHAIRQHTPPLALGEGPVWHMGRGALFFVDIEGRYLYGFREDEGVIARISAPEPIGFVVPWGAHLLAGVGVMLCRVDLDTEAIIPLRKLDLPSGLRFNDGKCDPEGLLWAGIMALDRSMPDTASRGALLGIDGDGVFQTVAPMDIPNGMAWSAEGDFYHTDTATGRIDRYRRYADGTIGERHPAFAVSGGAPDGFCIDTEGMLWIALWGGGSVQRFDPRSGRPLAEHIALPERNVSCCCFGGVDMNTLFINSGSGEGECGGLYTCRTDARGLPPYGFQSTKGGSGQ